MSTKIEWTDETWNPIRGCSRVSEGCRNCYAEKTANRFKGDGGPYEGLVQLANGRPQWTGKIKFVEEHLLDPLRWKRPRRVFVNSMSDLFHENVTDEMLDRIFAVMALAPQHTFQVLTKRPERMLAYLTQEGLWHRIKIASEAIARSQKLTIDWAAHRDPKWLDHVWLGVSVEDQKAAAARIPLLLRTPAAVRFISAEPLLGAIDLTLDGLACEECPRCADGRQIEPDTNANGCRACDGTGKSNTIALDWVICGGESGPGARPMHPDWARGLRDQCIGAGVPFFFKQWGEWQNGSEWKKEAGHEAVVYSDGDFCGSDVVSITAHLKQTGREHTSRHPTIMARVGKKAAGHLLDGKEWHQFPGREMEQVG